MPGERKNPAVIELIGQHVHAEHDDITWLRGIETCKVVGTNGYKCASVWINPADTRCLGIQNGAIVSCR
ncbi:MAG TPA: hypothetical protein DCP91_05665 [Eggerthellaceae bacterium]|nr:hypothetical protein [Eggerthellaceae bacterium]